MFGLMKRGCGGDQETRRNYRLHYCGTCKTMGSRYGQRTRMALNHDAVFLAELLSLLRNENPPDWQRAYQSYNCMSMPAAEEQPFSLRYAAAATVFLADAKLADHEQDSPSWRWRWMRRFFDSGLRNAERDLTSWGVPLKAVRTALASQKAREAHDAGMRHWAAPTAEATALFFAHGAPEARQAMFDFGHAFGTLIYALDAWEDRAKDAKQGQFNALAAEYGERREPALAALRQLLAETEAVLDRLPLADADKARFLARLRSNVERKLQPELKILHSCSAHGRRSWAEAKKLAANLSEQWEASGAAPLAPILLAPVVLIAWLAPNHARQTHSYSECLSLSANLMALGAVWGTRRIDVERRRRGGACRTCCGCCEACQCACCACECFECCECCESCGSCCSGCD